MLRLLYLVLVHHRSDLLRTRVQWSISPKPIGVQWHRWQSWQSLSKWPSRRCCWPWWVKIIIGLEGIVYWHYYMQRLLRKHGVHPSIHSFQGMLQFSITMAAFAISSPVPHASARLHWEVSIVIRIQRTNPRLPISRTMPLDALVRMQSQILQWRVRMHIPTADQSLQHLLDRGSALCTTCTKCTLIQRLCECAFSLHCIYSSKFQCTSREMGYRKQPPCKHCWWSWASWASECWATSTGNSIPGHLVSKNPFSLWKGQWTNWKAPSCKFLSFAHWSHYTNCRAILVVCTLQWMLGLLRTIVHSLPGRFILSMRGRYFPFF